MIHELQLAEDLAEYEDFINAEDFANNKLSHYIADVQRVYCADKRPWVIGYSGGKDSSAVMSLVYLALLGLEPKDRHKPVFVVSSDTLVETPVVVNHIKDSLAAIEKGAKRDNLPITCHKVVPKDNQTFWANLLGKGYPAPTRSFRWCTERMKIDPVSDFIKSKVSQFDEVIVVLGSRSQESASRAQVIAKHKIDGSRLARHTTLANAFIFTPIDTWGVDDVWKLLRLCHLETKQTPYGPKNIWIDKYDLEWENPWGGKNLVLWNLYKDSSGQGECPMVIDETTPSCGNSRFGCWTCTVVTKDRAMESLIQNGEEWMAPLLEFRNKLSMTTDPANKEEYRNHKRRTGKVSYQYAKEGEDIATERKHVPGPYWLKYRRQWLRELLELDKKFKAEGREIELITVPELHAIRQEWIHDPNEPDWDDSLPKIFKEVYGYDLDWVYDDNASFGKDDAQLIHELCDNFDIAPEMIMKLIELEVSMEGLSRRSGISNKIASLLKRDWGSLEEIKQKHASLQSKAEFDIHQKEIERYNDQLAELDKQLQKEF
ncbi:TPA: DNA phosphorothioation system sulfurtransferase DndC [Vibrio parahaemolyticus]|uniref:Phosphoadenosine phosphosulphate reductase domain-containing protein n=1 Tax=Vibrio spartinae TaxID=1918945 RepID=A0A1N6M7U1_9VIBR|nr:MULTISPECIES: DNA phosphorothioation system sulfurtransferase DndC [Vibrio]EFO51704.1 putative sulfurtransferase DndC [Vibrio parahaemolyticus K5030]EGQ8049097.1 DNA phosphorothioation system sulfurtransferase DndC [Vibrio parahaemolyticus]EGQ8455252.1 phosphoadenosine phosphosulfate reductase family protein [Vibrio parahaemolyticus]EGQ8463643.1 phosphoadenosine phosphosulfate reductase family protein [Vibrio parahaemolyticus]EGQ8902403.1 phosphoadenosine phosphosulfate reductase family pro